MAFNVFAHNRDDHSKNFAYLMDSAGDWHLAPAYDLTFSSGISGYHTTAVGGESRAPTMRGMRQLARDAGLDERQATEALEEVAAAVAEWPSVAKVLDISDAVIKRLGKVLDETCRTALESRGPRGHRPR
jgi:serine/threonine-protein kinase HipA